MRTKLITSLVTVCLLLTSTSYASELDIVDKYFGTVQEYETAFSDIQAGSDTAVAVEYLAKYGIVNGFGDGTFLPEAEITRAQFVKILVCAFGLYDETAQSGFTDCGEDMWFYPYVSSAYALELVNGISDTEFSPESNITREQMFTMCYRCAVHSGKELDTEGELPFSDTADISDYATEAVTALYNAGAIEGYILNPRENATRAQASELIYLLLKNT